MQVDSWGQSQAGAGAGAGSAQAAYHPSGVRRRRDVAGGGSALGSGASLGRPAPGSPAGSEASSAR